MSEILHEKRMDWAAIEGSEQSFSKNLVTSKDWSNFSLHYVRVEPNGEIVSHTHAKEGEAHFIISGTGIAFVDGERFEVEANSVVLAEADVPHGIRNEGSDPLFMLCIFQPPVV